MEICAVDQFGIVKFVTLDLVKNISGMIGTSSLHTYIKTFNVIANSVRNGPFF